MSTKRFKTRFVNWNPYDSSRNTLPRKSITSLITTQNQSCYYNLIFTKVKIKTPIKEKNNKKGSPKIKFKRRKKIESQLLGFDELSCVNLNLQKIVEKSWRTAMESYPLTSFIYEFTRRHPRPKIDGFISQIQGMIMMAPTKA